MAYLVAKKFDETGCIALQVKHGQYLAGFKKKLAKMVGYDCVQLITISQPSAYGEYEPYHFVESEQAFEQAVIQMK
jgi:hypothetical protein